MSVFIQDLKQALRNLRRMGWQAAISAIGLAVGIVCLTLSLNWLWTETHYDSFRPDYDDLYVMAVEDSTNRWPSVSYKVVEQLDHVWDGQVPYGVYKGIQRMKCFLPDSMEHAVYLDGRPATAGLPEVLGTKVLSGSVERALDAGEDVQWVITRSMAMRMFGTDDVVGRSLGYYTWNGTKTVVVGAVIEDNTGETNVPYDFILPFEVRDYELEWGVLNYHVLCRTSDSRRAGQLLDNIQRPDDVWYSRISLCPLRTLHKLGENTPFVEAYFYPLAFVIISLILSLSAWINLIAVYTSVFLGNIREYTLRRSFGASTLRNAGWMLVQILPVFVAAVLMALMAMEWCLSGDGIPGSTSGMFRILAWVLATFSLLILAGMVFPVEKMRRAYRRSFSGLPVRGKSHAWLLVVQCFACAFLLFLSWSMQSQISGMIHADLGFERENMLRLYTGWQNIPGQDERFDFEPIFDLLPQEFRKETSSGITDAIAMRTDIFNSVTQHEIDLYNVAGNSENAPWGNGEMAELESNVLFTSTEKEDESMVAFVEIPFRAQEFFGLKVDGGLMTSADDRPGTLQVLLNDVAAKRFATGNLQDVRLHTGLSMNAEMFRGGEASDEHIRNAEVRVCGTVGIRLRDFYSDEKPLMLVGIPENHKCYQVEHDAVYVKFALGRRDDAEAAVRKVLERFDVPKEQISLMTLDEYIAGRYKDEAFYADLLMVLAAFCVFVTVSGVISMLLYSLRMRRRSMAIRRVMGADFRDIFRRSLWGYWAYAVIGCVSAYFPAVILMHKWMEYFYYGEMPGVGLMAGILAVMLVVVSLIVYWQVRRCMNEKPVDVLRPEA